MKEKYLYIFLLLLITSFSAQAQQVKNSTNTENVKTENTLEKVQIYPNPVTSGKFTVNTESNTHKLIEVDDVLGKKVLNTEMTTYQKEVNVSHLKAGVYILKLTEKNNSVTRKVIIK